MKQTIKRLITGSRVLLRLLDRLGNDMPRVLVYHRFTRAGEYLPHRVSADELAWQLDVIRRDFNTISLAECAAYFNSKGKWPEKSVVLTIDDGYRDMYQYAYPELRKRNMTATFFVTTRFIEGELWLWPDRLEYALNRTTRQNVTINIADRNHEYNLRDEAQRNAAWKLCSDYCIGISDDSKLDFISNLERMLAVEPPCSPPTEYSASTWDEISEMRANGIEIGSHTCNHPILSRIEPALLDGEIMVSRQIIEQQLGSSISSFCYPNSAPADINDAVVDAVVRGGFGAAVFGTDLTKWDLYRIPRMGVTNDRNDFLWKLFGLEHSTLQLNRILAGETRKPND